MKWVFGIITNGKRPAKLRACLDSIWAQSLPLDRFEVCVCGDVRRAYNAVHMEGVRCFDETQAADEGNLGAMRNRIAREGRPQWDAMVISDDDMVFAPDFLENLETPMGRWDILCPRIENPDGTRYWDWATCEGKHGHKILGYRQKVRSGWYATGGMFVAKIEVLAKVKWPEDRIIGQGEDAEFGRLVLATGFRIKPCPTAVVTHTDPTLTSELRDYVYKKEEPDG